MGRHDSLNILGLQCKCPHAEHGYNVHKSGLPQCKYYGSVNHNDPAVLMSSFLYERFEVDRSKRMSTFLHEKLWYERQTDR